MLDRIQDVLLSWGTGAVTGLVILVIFLIGVGIFFGLVWLFYTTEGNDVLGGILLIAALIMGLGAVLWFPTVGLWSIGESVRYNGGLWQVMQRTWETIR